jgi:DNA-nicking Smr family endonuclease
MSDDDGEVGTRLGALLEPVLHTLAIREVAPEPKPEPKPRMLDERELMALIFVHLDRENPRVCEGIEFERFEILSTPVHDSGRASPVAEPEPSPTEPSSDPPSPESPPMKRLELELGLEQRVGAAWADDIAAVPGDWLEHPQLSAAQQQLLARARRRAPASLNLRRLDRETALRHVELFVRACQARRVAWCRLITGKGIGSVGEPVLKRAVLEWCRGPGRTRVLEWAPELDSHGEWGVLVVRLSSASIGGRTAR